MNGANRIGTVVLNLSFVKFPFGLILVFGVICPVNASSDIESLNKLEYLTKDCLSSGNSDICINALKFAEIVQRRARLNEDFSCQAYALGLGADLLMFSLDEDRGKSANYMLDKVKKICRGF